jgi:hypothetical protein
LKRGDWVLLDLAPDRSPQARRALASGLAQVISADGAVTVVKPQGSAGDTFTVSPSEILRVVAES